MSIRLRPPEVVKTLYFVKSFQVVRVYSFMLHMWQIRYEKINIE